VTFTPEERSVPPSASTPTEYSALPQFGVRGPARSYARFLVRYTRSQLTAQVIVLPQNQLRMSVRAHSGALDVNFTSNQVTHPEEVETYLDRPGFYLHERLVELKEADASAIVFNGNNIGYWGNQFVIQNRKLKYKRRGPIFDDGRLGAHANGDHAFFLASRDTFRIESLALVGTQRDNSMSLENLTASAAQLPRFGLSGFPLLRGGRRVWRDHGALAWDPGLLFDLGRIRGFNAIELRDYVLDLLKSGAELARHPMTVIGIDVCGRVVLLVVERSRHSRGMTVAEAADLLSRRFAVRDAIVLGAAGDAQLATTEEGVLTEPLVASHARPSARRVPDELLSGDLRGREVYARPVPCYVQFELTEIEHAHEKRPLARKQPAAI
jgi:hypothetical protein